jgi:hypothetical protein
MSSDEALALSEEERAAFELAILCGLTRRNGPLGRELDAMPGWRRRMLRLLPRRHRWRLSYLAPDIRRFERSECHTSGVPSGISSGGDDV